MDVQLVVDLADLWVVHSVDLSVSLAQRMVDLLAATAVKWAVLRDVHSDDLKAGWWDWSVNSKAGSKVK
jgi:hypothetical protein